ncbi:MAG TPA: DNA polymerase III subunit epsilon [Aliidongia sp.]|nr:DNA polymerase III subunit epsilon [Aliidongia sp.]
MREIVLDTETTGLDPADGHRVVEVACVELFNLLPTGEELHFYCNPERDMPAEAMAVHGLTEEFLRGHPLFDDQAEKFVNFMGDAKLIAHNAEFDVRFLQAELQRCNRPRLGCAIVDTVQMARRKYPGASASLDALCRRFGIDLSGRAKHGALIDTRLLAKVYLELMGGQQPDLGLAAGASQIAMAAAVATQRIARPPRPHAASEEELAAHQAMLQAMKDPLWLKS